MEFHNHRSPLLVYLQLVIFFFINVPWLQANASGNETDRLALLKFKQGISSDPHGIFNSWNDSLHFCKWYGITCGRRHQRVTSLDLKGQNLIGSISPHIGNLSFLRTLDLENNSFHDHIPQEVGKLFRLQYFLLNNNTLQGEVPSNLSRCSQLRIIDLLFNEVEGKIPAELGNLANLEMLLLGVNKIRGEIPTSLCNLSSLTRFSVTRNNLVGTIPVDMGRLTSLTFFTVAANHLSGIIPASLFNISSIIFFSAAANRLNGSIPDNIGQTLPNLQQFHIGGNEFSGSVPNSFSNASNLVKFSISINRFEGQVPRFGNHQNLLWLEVSQNNLGNNSANDLEFLTSLKNCSNLEILDVGYNNFGGFLPNSIANLSVQLNGLYFGGNQITGIIPEALESLINLMDLGMEDNFFTGVIPSYFGKFQKLQRLLLWHNRLSGRIPSSFGNLTQLSVLILSQNNFDGSIPLSIGNCRSLNVLNLARNNLNGAIPQELTGISSLSILLNLAHNSFTGNLPVEVGKLGNVNTLDVAENKLSGEIPTTIGDCLGLEYLYMAGNSFQGTIPSSLASLRGLQELDLSRNNLRGEIPKDLQNLRFLLYLNLSFNNLEGQVPTKGVFTNASALSLIGNTNLCGGVPELSLPKCPVKKKGNPHHALKLGVIISFLVLFVLLVLVFLFAYRHRKSKKSTSSTPLMTDQNIRVSYHDLHLATNGFSSVNLIGSGSFGSVYKGFINQMESPVAIKVLKLQQKGASKSFMAECNALRNVRHRNLVKLLTYCSSLDYKQNEFKALIFEFMENGSLENWLHHNNNDSNSQPKNYLNFIQRLNIAVDVASVLHYLHDLCESPIIHCDLKPSNVLLDEDMIAHVSDFGLARLFLTTAAGDLSQGQSSSTTGIKGTFGYAPPEYAMGSAASKEGDVYSYGILLLEMFSGKRPTDKMFEDGLNLHNFVKNALPKGVEQIMDQSLLPTDIEGTSGDEKEDNSKGNFRQTRANDQLQKGLLSVFEVGIACSRESPKERTNMRDVSKELHLMKSAFVGVRIYG
ncbi:probable LRR receptor-like serine/threonine-protein kinase At3g47570 [Ricinus communis]|uniref:probable LRR receptor-like serine/threonine-protein kinase At3g47570 n=1 Tax=Ricinus communis TaxID=3988 RepID=UPI000D69D7D6|nr:probable LRR receptor-like serine/threonine-protein kinase At3g47570 [Ricinus communis]|eukprot:XP_015570799.2 probable LRR receptor-like serine/threonine-protein kinase At3g47570 [Ricinus communis]